jgi:hypothetical protein
MGLRTHGHRYGLAGRLCKATLLAATVVMLTSSTISCGDDDNDNPPPSEFTGQACAGADECYPWLDGGTLSGDRVCLDRVPGGYCTHECEQDSDCCATEGECRTAHPQVCAPFESTGIKMCFLSCEEKSVEASGVIGPNQDWDADQYCQTYAWDGFKCRSSGGGSENRKVCTP